jgi:hypothetical protein
MASANDIVADAQKQLAALQAIDAAINTKVAAIKDAEWNGPLSDGELNQIATLRKQEQPILAAIEELSYVTMGALDKSDEVTRIANAFTGIIKGLTAQADGIAAIDSSAKNIGSICTALGKLVPQIQGLSTG